LLAGISTSTPWLPSGGEKRNSLIYSKYLETLPQNYVQSLHVVSDTEIYWFKSYEYTF
jgi:hypothetical protein